MSEEFDEDVAEELISRFHKKLVSCKLLDEKDPNGFSNMISNLEKQFFVSSKSKSLYDCLKEGPYCSNDRDFPLRRRIGTLKY